MAVLDDVTALDENEEVEADRLLSSASLDDDPDFDDLAEQILEPDEEALIEAAMQAMGDPPAPFDDEAPSRVRRRKPRPKTNRKKSKSKTPAKTKSKTKKADDSWRQSLTLTARGAVGNTAGNAIVILRHDPRWQGVLAYDLLMDRPLKTRAPKWHPHDRPAKRFRKAGPWTDLDSILLRSWFEREYEILIKAGDIDAAVEAVSHAAPLHGPRDWLRSLVDQWDGVSRVDTWLVRFGGAADTPYVRAVSRMWLISAVARAFEPGCQVDHTLILEGRQGLGKSSLLAALVPQRAWFLSDVSSELGKLDSFQLLQGKWIVEMSELDSLGRSTLSAAKAFMTNRVDTFRRSYGKRAEDRPRQCVFAGSTNKEQYLGDETGNRRFWPVPLKSGDVRGLVQARQQLFAEAVNLYLRGELWHITDPEMASRAVAEQAKRVQSDPWEYEFARFLTDHKWITQGVTTRILLQKCLKMAANEISRTHELRAASSLRAIGWSCNRARQRRIGTARIRLYFPAKTSKSAS